MTAQMAMARTTSRHPAVLPAMWCGLALTIVAAVFPLIDRGTTHVLADHIRASYPSYGAGQIDAAVTAYLSILAVVGVLGVLGWLGTMWTMRRHRGLARWVASGAWLIAACVALSGLTVQDTSGDVGLAPLPAWLLVLPCVPGLLAVALLWRPRR